jgi:hypothetical protein
VRFSEAAERFMRIDADRLVALAGILSSSGLRYSVVKLGEARHLLVSLGPGIPRLALVAHYDRVAGSPGALDNSCACLQLAAFAARANSRTLASPLLVAFTDAEEAPASGEAFTQGSFALARNIKAMGEAGEGMAALVFDVTGRGDRLLLSTTPAEMLARRGLATSPAALGQGTLISLAARAAARAGLAAPLRASLPWSDDLGLTLGGLPALTLSLLPELELPLVAAGKRPPTWKFLHTAADAPELAESGAFDTMALFLDSLALELAPPP